ncbi:MAG: non-hydrolyzing UDP-N-acetylglucosamine 2-epimerase [Bacteroidota bacterium]
MSRKIFTVIGARPQFIKAAAVSRAFKKMEGLQEIIIHTGQHFDDNMSRVFFDELDIPPPAHHLNIHSLSHGAMTGRMVEALEKLMMQEKPDRVMVYGDTNSTLAGALAASKLHIPVAHVEAGLRSFNMFMPEEINRILTDRVSNLLFCPTPTAVDNLKKEGFDDMNCKIIQCGDVMYDAALYYTHRANKPHQELPAEFVLATLHRAENTDNPQQLSSILTALSMISEKIPVVLPLHPRTANIIRREGIITQTGNMLFTPPMGYLQMIWLLQHCNMVMTDSGGLQKEAYFFRKPCITLREETEWTELTQQGVNKLVGAHQEKILQAFEYFSSAQVHFPDGLYGRGNAAMIIAQNLLEDSY